MALFQQLNREGVTLLLVTHDLQVAQHASRVVRMSDGRIIADEPVADRLDAREVLAAMPAPEPDNEVEVEEA